MEPTSCACAVCKSYCIERVPGWFMPGQLAKAARFMKMPPKEFFMKYCQFDYWVGNTEQDDIFVVVPRIVGEWGGTTVPPGKPHGRCVFMGRNEKCRIYPARPMECAVSSHSTVDSDYRKWKEGLVLAWGTEKGKREIKRLGKPQIQPFTLVDAVELLGNTFGEW